MVYSTEYTQDGASANNREFGGSARAAGAGSQIGEVRVETSTGNAKSSSPTSVIVSTRSGTNRYRAALYETIRNNASGRGAASGRRQPVGGAVHAAEADPERVWRIVRRSGNAAEGLRRPQSHLFLCRGRGRGAARGRHQELLGTHRGYAVGEFRGPRDQHGAAHHHLRSPHGRAADAE